jgi:hypothetical protein
VCVHTYIYTYIHTSNNLAVCGGKNWRLSSKPMQGLHKMLHFESKSPNSHIFSCKMFFNPMYVILAPSSDDPKHVCTYIEVWDHFYRNNRKTSRKDYATYVELQSLFHKREESLPSKIYIYNLFKKFALYLKWKTNCSETCSLSCDR